ncbi:MAG: HIT domain-containing protein [Gammaproteobacteria bacterium]|nr:HIT domain-containing protein [Gammaproteobacteria bacterium]
MADIHPQLLNDCHVLGRFTLCHLLLSNDSNYPWFILVPDREHVSEIFQLPRQDQAQLLTESSLLSAHLMSRFKGDKLNVAALGNVVPQLHVHHIVRFKTDPAWPAPIWGRLSAKPYSDDELSELMQQLDIEALPGFSS